MSLKTDDSLYIALSWRHVSSLKFDEKIINITASEDEIKYYKIPILRLNISIIRHQGVSFYYYYSMLSY